MTDDPVTPATDEEVAAYRRHVATTDNLCGVGLSTKVLARLDAERARAEAAEAERDHFRSLWKTEQGCSVGWLAARNKALDRADAAEAEAARLRRGDWTPEEVHDLCHDLHGKVGAREFADGCAAEQRKLYGRAPDADLITRLRALLREAFTRLACDWPRAPHNTERCLRCRVKAALEEAPGE